MRSRTLGAVGKASAVCRRRSDVGRPLVVESLEARRLLTALSEHDDGPAGILASTAAEFGSLGVGVMDESTTVFGTSTNTAPVASPDEYELFERETLVAPGRPASGPSYVSSILDHAPVAYWRLGDATGPTANDAASNHHGQLHGNVALGQRGAIAGDADTAARFDGDGDAIDVPDAAELRPSGAFSVEAWIYPDSAVGTYDSPIMKATNGSWTDGYGLYYQSGQIHFFVNDWSGSRVSAPISVNQWQHVVGTFDAGTLRIFVNRVLVDSASVSATVQHSTGLLQIGEGAGGYGWTGALDEVALYDRALTEAEIAGHFAVASVSTERIVEADREFAAPADVATMRHAPDYQTLAMLSASGTRATLFDVERGAAFAVRDAETQFTDLSLTPDGRYLFVVESAGGQLGAMDWIHRYDLATRTWHREPVDVAALRVAAIDGDTIALLADASQPVVTLNRFDAGDGDAIVEVDRSAVGSLSNDSLAMHYDPTLNRIYAVATGSETTIVHWAAIAGELTGRTSTIAAVASESSTVLSSDGQHLYVGNAQFATADLSRAPRMLLTPVLAADASVAYAASGLYGAESLVRWGQLALTSDAIASNASDRQVWAYREARLYRYTIPVGEGPLANDVDADGDLLSIDVAEPPAHGLLQVTDDGGFRYTPYASFIGDDHFAYRAVDGLAGSAPTTIALHIRPLVPTAAGDDYVALASTELDVAASEGVLANDVDPHGTPLTAMLVAGPSHGSLTLTADGAFRYVPNDAHVGVDSFAYRAVSASAASKVATVVLQVAAPNEPPVAVDDQYGIDQGATLVVNNPGPRFANYSHVVAADGPVGYWRLGETSGDVAADETAGHPGQYSGNILRGQPGAFAGDGDTSIALDGSAGVILVPHDASLDTTALSVEAWIRPEAGISLYDAALTKASDSSWTDGYGLYYASTGDIVFFVNDYSSKSVSVPVPIGQWQHIVGTFDGNVLRLYRNGLLVASRALSESIDHSTADLRIGQGEGSSNYTWTGGLDEVALYGHALSAVAIEAHYQAGIGPTGSIGGLASSSPDILFGVLNNDVDDDSELLTAALVAGPSHGELVLNSNGTFRYTPDPQFFGEDSFTYRANDGLSTSNVATVGLTVMRVPTPPVAAVDSYSTPEDTPLSVLATAGVLSNDVDADGERLSAILVEPPAHGALAMLPSGAFRYTPAADYFGPDTFTYRADNGSLQSSPVVVSLTVHELNDPPATAANAYATAANTLLVATSDSPPSLDLIVADSIADFSGTQGKNGWHYGYFNRSTDADGQYRTNEFIAFPNSGGPWSATNYFDAADSTWEWFNGNPPWTNFNPERMHPNGTNSGQEHWAIRRWVSDSNGAAIVAGEIAKSDAGIGGGGIRGMIVVNGSSVFAVDIAGTDRIGETFAIPLSLEVGTIVDFVVAPNGGDSLDSTRFVSRITRGEGLPMATLILPSGATWKYRDDLSNGAAYPVDAEGDRWIETDYEDAGWPAGPAILGYDVIDAGPVATRIGYGGNPANKYRTALFRGTFSLEDAQRIGVLLVDGLFDDGAAIYINGSEVVRYNLPGSLGDGSLTTNALAVSASTEARYVSSLVDLAGFPDLLRDGANTIAVEVHQMRPDSSDLGFDLELSAIVLSDRPNAGVLANDADVEGSSLAAVLVAGPYRGALAFESDGTFEYTPAPGFEGVDQFTYRATDGAANSATTLVTINVGDANAAPLAADDRFVARSGAALTIGPAAGVLKNDIDPNGDALSATVLTPPARGTLSLADDGSFTYTPQGSFRGVDVFTYRVADNDGTIGLATATIHVVPQIDPINGVPLAGDDAFATTESTLLSVAAPGVLGNDFDAERRPIVAVVERSTWHGSLSFAADGSFTYTPLPGFTGQDSFTYRASDANTFSAPTTVTIDVMAPMPANLLLPGPAVSGTMLPIGTQAPGPGGSSTSTVSLPMSADLNGDGRVDRADLAVMVAAYGATAHSPAYVSAADLNNDGRLSLADAIVLRNRMTGIAQPSSSSALVRRAGEGMLQRPRESGCLTAVSVYMLDAATVDDAHASNAVSLRASRSSQVQRLSTSVVRKSSPALIDHAFMTDGEFRTLLVARRIRLIQGVRR